MIVASRGEFALTHGRDLWQRPLVDAVQRCMQQIGEQHDPPQLQARLAELEHLLRVVVRAELTLCFPSVTQLLPPLEFPCPNPN